MPALHTAAAAGEAALQPPPVPPVMAPASGCQSHPQGPASDLVAVVPLLGFLQARGGTPEGGLPCPCRCS